MKPGTPFVSRPTRDRPEVQARAAPGGCAAAPKRVRLLGAAVLFALALLVAGASVPYDADLYDEGLIANGGALALRGQLPGASFYAPYPPGAFYALALAFRIWGERLIVERWLAAALAALAGAIGFLLISGQEVRGSEDWRQELRANWLAALAVTLLLATRWVTPFNGGALVLVLASGLVLRDCLPEGRRGGSFLCGAWIGAAALWRLDFGLYAFAAGLVVWSLFAGWERESATGWRGRLAGAAVLSIGVLVISGPPLAWVLARGGHRAADSLFWWPISSTGAARLPWTRYWSAFLMPLAAVLLSLRAFPMMRRDRGRAALASWLLLVGLGFLIYALGRTHATHLLPLRVVSLLLVGSCIGIRRSASTRVSDPIPPSPRPTRSALLTEALAFFIIIFSTTIGPVREFIHASQVSVGRTRSLPGPRGTGVYPSPREVEGYGRVMGYLDQQVPGGAHLFCGAPRHDLFLKDDNLAYFLSGRDSGTYYWCLDAAVTTTAPVQEEMVRELEASRVEVVLIRVSVNREKNASSRSSGVHLLDDYLRRHFYLVDTWQDYRIYRRRKPSASLS